MDSAFLIAQILISLYLVSKVGTEWAGNAAEGIGLAPSADLVRIVVGVLLFIVIFAFSSYIIWGMLILFLIYMFK